MRAQRPEPRTLQGGYGAKPGVCVLSAAATREKNGIDFHGASGEKWGENGQQRSGFCCFLLGNVDASLCVLLSTSPFSLSYELLFFSWESLQSSYFSFLSAVTTQLELRVT